MLGEVCVRALQAALIVREQCCYVAQSRRLHQFGFVTLVIPGDRVAGGYRIPTEP
jgi:hypothetical protein